MLNSVNLVGRLTKNVEVKQTSGGIPYARFTLAVNRPFSDANGEKTADFISCIAWRKQAENLAKFMSKGSLIAVSGRVQTGSYEQDGTRHYTTDIVCEEVIFLESKNQNNTGNSQNNYSNNQPYENQQNHSNNQPYGNQQNHSNNQPYGNQQNSYNPPNW